MYQKFFDLQQPPFAITPDPHFLFLGRNHQEALAHLLYSIRGSSGFILLTGEVGAGKTMISRCLIQQMPSDVDIALIFNPRLSALELVASICDDLKIPYPETAGIKTLFGVLNRHLLNNYANNRITVLILDEAQNLSVDLLEQIRLISNLETDKKKLLQIILIGQPELADTLAKPELRQFSQRITARYHIAPLSTSEARDFVRHRLAVAGCKQPIFGPGVLWLIHYAAKGIPRLINQICDRALLGAYTLEVRRVNFRICRAAIREVMGMPKRRTRRPLLTTLVLLGLIVGIPLFLDIPTSWNNFTLALPSSHELLQSFMRFVPKQHVFFENSLREDASMVPPRRAIEPVVIPEPPQAEHQASPPQQPAHTTLKPHLKLTATKIFHADKPVVVGKPLSMEQPDGIHEKLAVIAKIPDGVNKAVSVVASTPVVVVNTPAIVDKKPTATIKTPNSVIEKPAAIHEKSAVTTETPVAIADTPAIVDEKRAITIKTPNKIVEKPVDIHEAPTILPKAPTVVNTRANVDEKLTVTIKTPGGAHAQKPSGVTEKSTSPKKPVVLAKKPDKWLETIFDTPKEETTNRFGIMTRLFSLWGVSLKELGGNPTCKQALGVGMSCANISGNWNTLRQLDLPAIITLAYLHKGPRYALVVGLGQKQITLQFAHKKKTLLLSEAERYWFGKMTILWRLTPGKQRSLHVGTRGTDVVWLRDKIEQIQKKASKSKVPELFDTGLAQRLRQFQEKLFLDPDGTAGFRSIVAIDLASKDPNRPTPRLHHIQEDEDH